MSDKEKELIENLLLAGALEVAGVDSDTGDLLYVFTPKLQEVMPELYSEHLNYVNSELMRLWEMGFVNMDLMSDNPVVTLAPKAFDEDQIKNLTQQDRWAILEIKRLITSGEL